MALAFQGTILASSHSLRHPLGCVSQISRLAVVESSVTWHVRFRASLTFKRLGGAAIAAVMRANTVMVEQRMTISLFISEVGCRCLLQRLVVAP